MRIAIISDIHGNYLALEKVFADIDRQDVDEVICLGDIVGYGPMPNECVELVKERSLISLMGNHDAAALGKDSIDTFNTNAQKAIIWTKDILSEEAKQYLSTASWLYSNGNYTYVHSSPNKPEEWTYIATIHQAMEQFAFFNGQVCFVGHTHVAIIFAQNQFSHLSSRNENLVFENSERYIVNVGAVGQPRDYDPRACYGILDTENNSFEFRRLEYDIKKTQELMQEVGLPKYLIERLVDGR